MSKRRKFVEGPPLTWRDVVGSMQESFGDHPADPKGTTRCVACGTVTDGLDLCQNCDDWYSPDQPENMQWNGPIRAAELSGGP